MPVVGWQVSNRVAVDKHTQTMNKKLELSHFSNVLIDTSENQTPVAMYCLHVTQILVPVINIIKWCVKMFSLHEIYHLQNVRVARKSYSCLAVVRINPTDRKRCLMDTPSLPTKY